MYPSGFYNLVKGLHEIHKHLRHIVWKNVLRDANHIMFWSCRKVINSLRLRQELSRMLYKLILFLLVTLFIILNN